MPGKFSAGREKTKNSHHHQSKVAKDHHRNLTGTNKSVESSATFSHLESLNNDLVSDQGGDYLDSIVHRSAPVVDNENDGPTTSCSARSSIIRQSDGNEDDDASSTGVLTHHSHTSNSTTFNPNAALSAATYAFKKKPFYILLPHSELRSSWDLYMSILLVYVAGFVPFRVSYLTSLQSWLKGLEMFIDISFGIDIILNFFTAYEVKGLSGKEEVYECRPKKIAVNYLKGYFVLDFLATFPFDLILKTEAARDYDGLNHASKLSKLPKIIKFLRVARLLRLLRVYRLQQLVRQIENNYNVHQGITRLLNIVSIIMFATHLVGCLWHAIGVNLDIEGTKENCPYVNDQDYDIPLDDVYDGGSWVCREGLINASNGHKYVASIYWAFSTLTTVGYGDISARTIGEQCFSMIMMLLGVSWYAYVVGSISTIISSFDRQSKDIRQKMLQVNTFIHESKLPRDLSDRIRKYFEYSLSKKSNGLFGYDADQILLELNSTIRTDVITHVERDLIAKIPFFEGKSSTFVANAVQSFQPTVVHEGDFIIKEGSAADEMYFLVVGRACVFYGNKNIKTLEAGSYFGEIGCILGGIRRASITAETTCELQCLSKRNLNLLLGYHPEVGEDLKKVARDRIREKQMNKQNRKTTIITKKSIVANTKNNHTAEKDNVAEQTQEKNGSDSSNLSISRSDGDDIPEKKDNIHQQQRQRQLSTRRRSSIVSFADLQEARRLSLTSGAVPTGNHIKVDEKTLQELNQDMTKPATQSQNKQYGENSEGAISNRRRTTISSSANNNIKSTSGNTFKDIPDVKKETSLIISSEEEPTKIINLVEKRLEEASSVIMTNNEMLLQKIRERLMMKQYQEKKGCNNDTSII